MILNKIIKDLQDTSGITDKDYKKILQSIAKELLRAEDYLKKKTVVKEGRWFSVKKRMTYKVEKTDENFAWILQRGPDKTTESTDYVQEILIVDDCEFVEE